MKKKLQLFLIIFCIFISTFIFQKNVEAKSYNVEEMDIQATVNNNGSVAIEQKIKFEFNGEYNGIYINIPYNLEDTELDEVVKGNKIDEKLYNGNSVTVQNVSVVTKNIEREFREVISARNGSTDVYTSTRQNGMHQIKVFSPTSNTSKTFKINYTINNLCVKHNDIGELYYNFIGGGWEVPIKNLNIDIYIPNNSQEINIWGHGPYNGESKIIDNTHARFKVNNIKPGQYVAARVLFDNSNIINAKKISGIDAKEIVFANENEIIENKEEKNAFTTKIIIFAICLFIYWIILMKVYEDDKKYKVQSIEEEKLFEKYNPMLAGCIQGSRTILARDIIAVILNLINKNIIKLDFQSKVKGKDAYNYIISKNKELENKMDGMEKFVYEWVFGNNGCVNLQDRLTRMPHEKDANDNFKHLNNLVEGNLATVGANQAKVPMIVRGFNIFLFILSLVLVVKHIMFNGFEIYHVQASWDVIIALGIYLIMMLPVIMGILYITMNLIVITRHKINKIVQKVTGQKVATTTISLVVLFGVIILLTSIYVNAKYLIADEILICIATILILTDNLMLKNNVTMIEDYSKLNSLKYKIENYSIMEDKDIEQITLWEKYLSYAVSFGVASKIVKRIQGLHLDDDLLNLVGSDNFSDFITSDYYMFYTHASLDRRFVKSFKKATGKMLKSTGSGGRSGGGRRIFRRRRILWRWRKRPEEAEHFKKQKVTKLSL